MNPLWELRKVTKLRSTASCVALIGALAFASTAVLADGMPRRASYAAPLSWTGFYAGVNAGYAWGDADVGSNFSCPAGTGCSVQVPANLANINAASRGSFSANGFTGGAQAGYNWQSGTVVYGVELDFNSFNLNGSRSVAVPSTTTTSIFHPGTSIDTDWLFTLRGRLGWTLTPSALLYATGGLAITDASVSNSYFTTNNPANLGAGSSSSSETLTGWVIGGGLEWKLDRKWSFKAEYLFVDFGSISTTAAITGPGFANPNTFSTSTDLTAQIARAGLNYKF
jgi:outer membrane immunogenic protein